MINLTKTLLKNLYKFIFVSGISITVLFIFIPEYMDLKWIEKSIQLKKESNEIKYKLSVYKNKTNWEYFEQRVFTERVINNQISKDAIRELYEKLKQQSLSRDKDLLEISRLNNNLNAEVELQNNIKEKINMLRQIQGWGIFIGVVMSICGLLGWLFRVQLPLDRKLKDQLNFPVSEY